MNTSPRILLSFFAVLALSVGARAIEVKSPDGHLVVDVRLSADGAPVYDLKRDGQTVLGESKLGLKFDDADLSHGLKWSAQPTAAATVVKDSYELLSAKRRLNNYTANRNVFELATAEGERVNIVFQVSNVGVGFRYVFPGSSARPRAVKSEETSFKFAANTKAWLQPMSVAKTFWAKVNPGYEEYHEQEIPVGTPSTLEVGWVFPALFRTGETWVLITEADLGRGYCATRLAHESPDGEYRIGFPDTRETIAGESVNPSFKTPYSTPWRVIAVGSLKTITESTLGTDLAAPAIAGVKPGAPGKASWSWAKLGDASAVYDVQRQFIDYAAEMGWGYCLIDALWDTQIGYEKMKDLATYARTKKVGVLVWYNSNGNWNDAPQTPLHLMADGDTRRKEFARLHEMGVAGVKVDFFGGDGRAFTELYRDILDDAARYELVVNFHGTTLPRGLERTYPNFLTAEAIRGYEFIVGEQKSADRAPSHMAMQPFTRNVFDSMDFTPLCLTNLPKVKRRTTVAAELASAVLFTSGIQHYVEIPDGMAKQPDYVRAALKEIPSVWEDSRFLAGYPGKLAVFARKGADGLWWIAGLNGENVAKTVDVDLAELGAAGLAAKSELKVSAVITDAATGANPVDVTVKRDSDFVRQPAQMNGTILRVELKPYGGFLSTAK